MTLELAHVTIDSENAAALAGFYAELLGRTVDPEASEYFATVGGAPVLMFIKVPDKTPGKNSVHLDLHTPERRAQVERALALGAKQLGEYDEYGARWTTLSDPEGNLFDIGDSR